MVMKRLSALLCYTFQQILKNVYKLIKIKLNVVLKVPLWTYRVITSILTKDYDDSSEYESVRSHELRGIPLVSEKGILWQQEIFLVSTFVKWVYYIPVSPSPSPFPYFLLCSFPLFSFSSCPYFSITFYYLSIIGSNRILNRNRLYSLMFLFFSFFFQFFYSSWPYLLLLFLTSESEVLNCNSCQAWWHNPIIPALRELHQED